MNMRAKVSVVVRVLFVLCVVLAIAGITMATWTTSVTSKDNVFATGDLDLIIRNEGSWDWDEHVHATWSATNMYPGQNLGMGAVHFINSGSFEGQSFDLAVSNTSTVADMDEYIEITHMQYENGKGHNMLDGHHLQDVNLNGWIDLDDLESQPQLALSAPSTTGALYMRYRFHPDAGNQFQAASVTADFTFTLHQ